jgi:hypothetical protein
MNSPSKVEPQKVVNEGYLIYPAKGLSGEDQKALEAEICSIVDEGTAVKGTTVIESEGIRYWYAALTPEQGENIKSLPQVCLR